jgi:hypothetical protein
MSKQLYRIHLCTTSVVCLVLPWVSFYTSSSWPGKWRRSGKHQHRPSFASAARDSPGPTDTPTPSRGPKAAQDLDFLGTVHAHRRYTDIHTTQLDSLFPVTQRLGCMIIAFGVWHKVFLPFFLSLLWPFFG